MRLAICCYVDNTETQLQEFGWLHASWDHSGRPGIIMAFCHPGATDAVALPGVRVIPLRPTTETHPEWKSYPFINSISYLGRVDSALFEGFTHILRTDCDCFLTPHFPRIAPRLPLFGRGTYVQTAKTSAKIAEIAGALGLNYTFVHNVGSTILAPVHAVLFYTAKQMEICDWLRVNAFADGRGEWPDWWWGVLTMYAGELAANAIFGHGITVAGLDCMSMSDDHMGALDWHIHAFTADQDFSKNRFRAGAYDGIKDSQINLDIVNNYCLFIARKAAKEQKCQRKNAN